MASLSKELTIFSYGGKNYIGYYCNFGTDPVPSFVGIGQTVTNYYIFQAPAEISYNLSTTSDATADLISSVMPLFPGGFVVGDANNIYFAFPKSDVILSNIKTSMIHANIVNQYKQLAKVS